MTIRPAPGNEIPAEAGNRRRKLRDPIWNDVLSATTWANNDSTTSVHSAAGLAAAAERGWGDSMAVEVAAANPTPVESSPACHCLPG